MDLRQPSVQSDIPRIVQALRSERVESVSCGHQHVIVVTVGGLAYALEAPQDGDHSRARAALLASSGRLSPLSLPVSAVTVSCGSAHVLIATDAGTIFAYGDG